MAGKCRSENVRFFEGCVAFRYHFAFHVMSGTTSEENRLKDGSREWCLKCRAY